MFDYRILGSLEVCEGDRVVAIGGARCRAVLAVLVICANRPVSVGRLIDEVWGEPAPASAGNVVQGHISDLRRALGREAIETRGDAYVLHIARGGRDVDRFEQLAAQGAEALAAGRAQDASCGVGEALALCRGPALAEIAEGGMLVAEALRLDEMRLHARSCASRPTSPAAAMQSSSASSVHSSREHPLREPLRAHLALALYRAGRHVEALDVLRETRRSLADESASIPAPGCRSSSGRFCSTTQRSPRRPAIAAAAPIAVAPQRSIMVAQLGDEGLDALIGLAAPLASRSDRELLVTALVDDAGRLGAAARGAQRASRRALLRDGVVGARGLLHVRQRRRGHRASRPATGHRPAARRVAGADCSTTRIWWRFSPRRPATSRS